MTEPAPMTDQDRVDVIELIAAYAHHYDSLDLDGYVDTFAPDGVFDGIPNSAGIHRGRKAIREYVGGLISKYRAGIGTRQSVHFMGLPHIVGSSDRCSARTYIIWFQPDDSGGVSLPAVGSYSDLCIKLDGRWYFEKRTIRYGIGSLYRDAPSKNT